MNIIKAAETAAASAYLVDLNKMYADLPQGTCVGCAACCSESVNVSFLEFSNIIINGISKLDETAKEQLRKNVFSYYLLEWVKPQKCPFLNREKKCLIYDTRPLPCRLFGFTTEKDYEANYQNIYHQNLKLALSLKEDQLLLPVSVVRKKIPYCRDFIPEFRLTKHKMEALYSKLINLDGQLYFQDLIDDSVMNSDLVGLMVDYYLEEADTTVIDKSTCFDLKQACLSHIQRL